MPERELTTAGGKFVTSMCYYEFKQRFYLAYARVGRLFERIYENTQPTLEIAYG